MQERRGTFGSYDGERRWLIVVVVDVWPASSASAFSSACSARVARHFSPRCAAAYHERGQQREQNRRASAHDGGCGGFEAVVGECVNARACVWSSWRIQSPSRARAIP